MTRKNLFIILVFIIALVIIITLVIKYERLNIAYKSVTAQVIENKVNSNNEIEQIEQTNSQDISEKQTDAVIDEQKEEIQEVETKETINEQPVSSGTTTTQTHYEEPKQTTQATKTEETTQKESTITTTTKVDVDFVGEYDIKNGGYAKYSDYVEAPKDWLEDWSTY